MRTTLTTGLTAACLILAMSGTAMAQSRNVMTGVLLNAWASMNRSHVRPLLGWETTTPGRSPGSLTSRA